MLKLIPSTDAPEYSCRPQPVIQVTHQFKREQLEALVRIAVETLGEDEVRDIIEVPPLLGEGEYEVYAKGTQLSAYVTSDYTDAARKAERLARETGRVATIYKIVAKAVPSTTTETKVTLSRCGRGNQP